MMNDTDFTESVGTTHKTIFIIFWVAAVSLNATSTLLLSVAAQRRPSWAHLLLLSIALTDTCVVVLGISLSVVSLFLYNLLYEYQTLCQFQFIVLNCYVLMSFCLVVLISLDQYLAVSHPFTYNSKILRHPKRSLKIIVVLLLTLPTAILLLSIACIVLKVDIVPLTPSTFCYYDLQSGQVSNIVIIAINTLIMGILLIMVVVCTAALSFHLHKLFRRERKTGVQTAHKQKTVLAKLSVIITIVFVSSTLLFVIVHILHLLAVQVDDNLDYLALCILLSNTVLFPILFILVRASVRQILTNWWNKLIRLSGCPKKGLPGGMKNKPMNMKRINKA